MTKKTETTEKLIQDHPERFDYGDFTASADHDSAYMDKCLAETLKRMDEAFKASSERA
jgi:hypothetical protein